MAALRTAVMVFGRFNPPTTGHNALITFLMSTAQRFNGVPIVYPSTSVDPEKNPLPFAVKVGFMKKFFPRVEVNDNPRIGSPVEALKDVANRGFDHVVMVVGSDRVSKFQSLGAYLVDPASSKYNAAKHIPIKKFTLVAVPGNRDADAEGIAGMSASKLRGFAKVGDLASFISGVPTTNKGLAQQLYVAVRKGMNLI